MVMRWPSTGARVGGQSCDYDVVGVLAVDGDLDEVVGDEGCEDGYETPNYAGDEERSGSGELHVDDQRMWC